MELKIEYLSVESLIPYENNAKKHPEEQIRQIANSIKEFGFKQPIVIDSNNIVIIGHGRLEAAKLLDIETVPCVVADDLTKEQIKALRLADNKVAESGWDFELLDLELEGILDIDMTNFGFENIDIDWDSVPELSEEEYNTPEHKMLECPSCHHVDRDIHFKKV